MLTRQESECRDCLVILK